MIAIHRIAGAASGGASPCFTNANAKTRTHETAKSSVIVRISRLFTSIAKSLRKTSNATLRNTLAPYDFAVAGAQTDRGGLVREAPAGAKPRGACGQSRGQS